MGVNRVPMPGDLRRDIPLDFKKRIVAVRAGKKVKRIADAVERPPAQLHDDDGVGKARPRRITGDGRDLGLMLGERVRIGFREMLGGNTVERRNPAGGGPVLQ